MHTQKLATPRFTLFILCLLASLTLAHAAPLRATAAAVQTADDADRARALQLFQESKFTEALPLLEKLAASHPDDAAVFEAYGFSLIVATRAIKDEKSRQKMIDRARVALLHAKELGDNSNLLQGALEVVGSGGMSGGKPTFSENKEADHAMQEAEASFAHGDLQKAASAYERALNADPHLYEAALFAGDMYFKLNQPDKSGEWFAKAIAINPDRETAYRYWGDALMMGQDKRDESRVKFVDAVVAEPYTRSSWVGLTQWADRYKIQLSHPKIEPQASVSPMKDNKMTITIDPKSLEKTDDGTSAWIFYGISRAAWTTSDYANFKKAYPDEKTYRHSLREEASAFRGVAELVNQQTKEGKIKRLDPALATLLKLNDEGLLEAYILFARADEGIAQDYDAYRKANRDKLRRYLMNYVMSGK